MSTPNTSRTKSSALARNILIALVLGIGTGLGFLALREHVTPETWAVINRLLFQDITAAGGEKAIGLFYLGGQLFVRALQLVIVPMVFTSVTLALCTITDTRALGRVSGKTLLFFLLTTVGGLLLASVVGFGVYRAGWFSTSIEGLTSASGQTASNPLNVILNMIPANIGAALSSNGSVLAVIFIAVAVGLSMNAMDEGKSETLRKLLSEINDLVVVFLDFVVSHFAPAAIYMLLCRTFASYGINYIKPALVYMCVTVVLLLVYLFVAYPIFVLLATGKSPLPFVKKILPVVMLGFSTSSSAATLPFNQEVTTRQLGVDPSVASFVLPLGMTINMDGTAIMQVVATLFIAGCAGHPIGFGQLLLIGALALIASVGTPAAPGAGAVVLFTILSGVGITSEAAMLAYTLILAINRPIEMLVTALNVVGDATSCMYVAKSEDLWDAEVYAAE